MRQNGLMVKYILLISLAFSVMAYPIRAATSTDIENALLALAEARRTQRSTILAWARKARRDGSLTDPGAREAYKNALSGEPKEKYMKALSLLKEVYDGSTEPEKEQLYYYLGRCYLRTGDIVNSEDMFRKAIQTDYNVAEAYFGLIQLSGKKTYSPEIRKTEVIFPYREAISRIYPYSRTAIRVAEYRTELAQKEAGYIERVEILGRFGIGHKYMWQDMFKIGDLYREMGMFDEAIKAYKWSAGFRSPDSWLSPGCALIWEHIAKSYVKQNNLNLAIFFYRKSLASGHEYSTEILQEIRTLQTEITDLVNQQTPRPDAEKLVLIGDMLREMELFDEAIKTYQLAEKVGGRSLVAKIAHAYRGKAEIIEKYRRTRTKYAILPSGEKASWKIVIDTYFLSLNEYEKAGDRVNVEQVKERIENLKKLR